MTAREPRWRRVALCNGLTGVETHGLDVVSPPCVRWRWHLGACVPHNRRSMVEAYYGINRATWPDMPRWRALLSAWRCWRMVRGSGGS